MFHRIATVRAKKASKRVKRAPAKRKGTLRKMPRPTKARLKAAEDQTALITKHAGLVKRIARQFARQYPQAEMDDLIQEGRIGLLAAQRRHDLKKGKFTTIAVPHIKTRIARAAKKSHSVPVGEKALRKGVRTYATSLKEDHRQTEGGIGRAQARTDIGRLLRGIPSEQVRVLKLRFRDGHSLAATAQKLKISKARTYLLERRAIRSARERSMMPKKQRVKQ